MPNSNFVDFVKIFLHSGKGGAGSVHFLRAKYIPKGGPDGGDGGRGGHIILKGNAQLWTLLHLKYKKHMIADDGEPGRGELRHGADGKDVVIEVPLGTVARDFESNTIALEITQNGEEKILLQGGRGGLGNDHFKSPTHQTPRYAQPGEQGAEGWFILELKLLADVGLVGFPNAGKSTLLSAVSAAKPKIADYPFTTLVPNLGIVSYRNDRSFIMADIPGIIEGAAEGRGLGLQFLRHIERNSLLLFMVPVDSRDIREEYTILLNELKKYNPELLDKKRILAVTKADLADQELCSEMAKNLPDIPAVFISSVTGYQVDILKNMIWKALNE